MSELPPVPPRDVFNGSLGDRYTMDYLRVMSNLGQHATALKQVDAFARSGMTRTEAHELLDIMTRIAQRSLSNEIKGVKMPPKPSREALMRAEVQRRKNMLKGKPKFVLIKGEKE